MQATSKVRIESSEVHKGNTFTVVTEPAADGFSHPSMFKVKSAQQLGSPGQTIEITLQINGIVRNKSWTDRNTGEHKIFKEGNCYLDVVDYKHIAIEADHTASGPKSVKSA